MAYEDTQNTRTGASREQEYRNTPPAPMSSTPFPTAERKTNNVAMWSILGVLALVAIIWWATSRNGDSNDVRTQDTEQNAPRGVSENP